MADGSVLRLYENSIRGTEEKKFDSQGAYRDLNRVTSRYR
jgi:hypothetical protein